MEHMWAECVCVCVCTKYDERANCECDTHVYGHDVARRERSRLKQRLYVILILCVSVYMYMAPDNSLTRFPFTCSLQLIEFDLSAACNWIFTFVFPSSSLHFSLLLPVCLLPTNLHLEQCKTVKSTLAFGECFCCTICSLNPFIRTRPPMLSAVCCNVTQLSLKNHLLRDFSFFFSRLSVCYPVEANVFMHTQRNEDVNGLIAFER